MSGVRARSGVLVRLAAGGLVLGVVSAIAVVSAGSAASGACPSPTPWPTPTPTPTVGDVTVRTTPPGGGKPRVEVKRGPEYAEVEQTDEGVQAWAGHGDVKAGGVTVVGSKNGYVRADTSDRPLEGCVG